jgi:predicted acylesterase/phospholipase RssA
MLVLQGGGALGAYECGVYKVLAERLDDLSIIAGTSIGAVNAGVIARNFSQPDRGVAALEAFWHELAFPVFPVWGSNPWLKLWGSVQAVLTSMTIGNPHLFQPVLLGGAPYSTDAMRETVASAMGTYVQGSRPRLIVTAVELETSQPVAFDSAHRDITPDHIVASGSLPPGFPPTEIDGLHYWDGGLWSNTPLPEVLAAVRGSNGAPTSTWGPDAGYQIYIVDVFPQQFVPPDEPVPAPPEVQARMGQIIYQDKTRSDASGSRWVTWCRELYEILDAIPPAVLSTLEAPLRQRLDQVLTEVEAVKTRLPVNVTRIHRASLPYEQISSGVDFSEGRIEALIEQGVQDARQAVA